VTTTITRQYLSDLVYKELGISKVEASNFIDDIFEFITLQLEKKNKVKIANFGSFNIRHKNERIGRNPKTKEQKVISSRTVVTFKPSKILKIKLIKMSEKSAEALKTIGEVAKELNLIEVETGKAKTYILRFWEKEFPQLKPKLRAKGRRYYTAENVKLLKKIQYLLKDKGSDYKRSKKNNRK
jgi:integration host factor subunit alpha